MQYMHIAQYSMYSPRYDLHVLVLYACMLESESTRSYRIFVHLIEYD